MVEPCRVEAGVEYRRLGKCYAGDQMVLDPTTAPQFNLTVALLIAALVIILLVVGADL